jgi:hypothetical protein
MENNKEKTMEDVMATLKKMEYQQLPIEINAKIGDQVLAFTTSEAIICTEDGILLHCSPMFMNHICGNLLCLQIQEAMEITNELGDDKLKGLVEKLAKRHGL